MSSDAKSYHSKVTIYFAAKIKTIDFYINAIATNHFLIGLAYVDIQVLNQKTDGFDYQSRNILILFEYHTIFHLKFIHLFVTSSSSRLIITWLQAHPISIEICNFTFCSSAFVCFSTAYNFSLTEMQEET